MSEPVIRRYRPVDLPDVYDVCVRTAEAGGDARGLYSHDDLMPDVFAGPYVAFEPSLAFVVESPREGAAREGAAFDAAAFDGAPRGAEARVSGYVLAVGDTRRFVEWFSRQWVPYLASRYAHVDPPGSREQFIAHLGFTPDRMLIPEVDEYPAHLHIDLLPELQRRGLGRALIDRLLGELSTRGVAGVHLTMDPANVSARAFYDRLGFIELPSSTSAAPVLGIRT